MQAPLLGNRDTTPRFYDALCLLHTEESLAEGYIILLTGTPPPRTTAAAATAGTGASLPMVSPTADLDEATIALGFASICDGNVVDSCFGLAQVPPTTMQQQHQQPGRQEVAEIKSFLSEAASSNEAVKKAAVRCYADAFGIAIRFQKHVRALKWWQRCLRYRKLVRKAQEELKENFQQLEDMIFRST